MKDLEKTEPLEQQPALPESMVTPRKIHKSDPEEKPDPEEDEDQSATMPMQVTAPKTKTAVDEIDDLIARTPREAADADAEALLCEHLQSARYYLAGGMLDEYRLSLGLLTSASALLKDKDVRDRVNAFVDGQKKAEPSFTN